jgi:hypothetical protein
MRAVPTIVGLFLVFPATLDGSQDPLITDRPDFTESPQAVDPGRVQIEAGYTFNREGELRLHSLGEVLVRIGAVNRFEVRLGLNSFGISEESGGESTGFEDVALGAKIALADGSSEFDLVRPAIGVLVGAAIPTGSGPFGERGIRPQATLSVGWPVSEALSVGANLGAASASIDDNRFAILSGSVALGIGLTDWLGAYAEAFGFANTENEFWDSGFLNGGFTFLVNPDLQLDLRLGVSLSDPAPSYFAGLGFGWRI